VAGGAVTVAPVPPADLARLKEQLFLKKGTLKIDLATF
jgi:hypothetical protein